MLLFDHLFWGVIVGVFAEDTQHIVLSPNVADFPVHVNGQFLLPKSSPGLPDFSNWHIGGGPFCCSQGTVKLCQGVSSYQNCTCVALHTKPRTKEYPRDPFFRGLVSAVAFCI